MFEDDRTWIASAMQNVVQIRGRTADGRCVGPNGTIALTLPELVDYVFLAPHVATLANFANDVKGNLVRAEGFEPPRLSPIGS